MTLTRKEIRTTLFRWLEVWNEHDLDSVMDLFHDEVVFENWTGARVKGKGAVWRAWAPWFANHGGFRFIEEETLIDETAQSALVRWRLEWPSAVRGYEGRLERRQGVDVLKFCDGKIIRKLAFSRTVVEIENVAVQLAVDVRSRPKAR
jgi:ketosteroid isomerase-like protein